MAGEQVTSESRDFTVQHNSSIQSAPAHESQRQQGTADSVAHPDSPSHLFGNTISHGLHSLQGLAVDALSVLPVGLSTRSHSTDTIKNESSYYHETKLPLVLRCWEAEPQNVQGKHF